MRRQDVAILLSLVALAAVAALALLDDAPRPASVPDADRPRAPSVAAPLVDPQAHEEIAPRLGGPAPELEAEVRRLHQRVDTLAAELASLREQQEEFAGAVDPLQDALEMLNAAMPRLLSARLSADRTAAIATLRNVTSAQAQVQASARVDVDQDGTGEFAGFLEMSGAVPGRMSHVLNPPVLSGAFRKLNVQGEAERSGYLFRFYLPGPRGRGIGEPQGGFDASSGIDADLAETTWCAYAWPVARGASKRTYFMNQAGDILFAEADYGGPGGGPSPDAAFQRAGAITGHPACNQQGVDGNTWIQGG